MPLHLPHLCHSLWTHPRLSFESHNRLDKQQFLAVLGKKLNLLVPKFNKHQQQKLYIRPFKDRHKYSSKLELLILL